MPNENVTETPDKAVYLDKLPQELTDEIKKNIKEVMRGIDEIAEPFNRLKEIFFSSEGENIKSAESIIRIINLFIQLSIMGRDKKDIPEFISKQTLISEGSIRKVLELTGLE
ncbi:MAG: hypothetical protein PHX30_00325 [Candidatus Pacebacteria bacterium]|nr:hypothetical protein [Candidatus Paceibacterota bacterium]